MSPRQRAAARPGSPAPPAGRRRGAARLRTRSGEPGGGRDRAGLLFRVKRAGGSMAERHQQSRCRIDHSAARALGAPAGACISESLGNVTAYIRVTRDATRSTRRSPSERRPRRAPGPAAPRGIRVARPAAVTAPPRAPRWPRISESLVDAPAYPSHCAKPARSPASSPSPPRAGAAWLAPAAFAARKCPGYLWPGEDGGGRKDPSSSRAAVPRRRDRHGVTGGSRSGAGRGMGGSSWRLRQRHGSDAGRASERVRAGAEARGPASGPSRGSSRAHPRVCRHRGSRSGRAARPCWPRPCARARDSGTRPKPAAP
jgi:hypothetical protein